METGIEVCLIILILLVFFQVCYLFVISNFTGRILKFLREELHHQEQPLYTPIQPTFQPPIPSTAPNDEPPIVSPYV